MHSFRLLFFFLLSLWGSFTFAGIRQGSLPSISSDSLEMFRVDSIECVVGDAFDDSKAYSNLDSNLYRVLNVIHLETRERVVRKLLLFDKGDDVNLYQLIESERFLRSQSYLSDAHIERIQKNGLNILRVHTSDNWTLTVPLSLEKPGNEWYYGAGLQENNFLGFGQTLSFYYGHNEFRDMYSALYEDSHFLFRYNHFKGYISRNTDGHTGFFQMNIPFLSRMKNQWSYTAEAYTNKANRDFYWSGDLPPGATVIHVSPDSVDQKYNAKTPVKVLEIEDFREDSVSLRLARSFGHEGLKLYLGATYDFHRLGKDYGSVLYYPFRTDENVYSIAENAVDRWVPTLSDSRPGFYFLLSHIRYDRLKNFHNVKWTEDVDKGYKVRFKVSKNSEKWGSDNNDWRFDYWIYLALGTRIHRFTLSTRSHFYFNNHQRRQIYECVSGEYIWHPNVTFSTALSGYMDTYKRAPYGYQLSLGGADGLYGLATSLYTGQARYYANLEQRFFPNFEIGTVKPVFVVFGSAGETRNEVADFEPNDIRYVAGIGIRLGMTKSITHLVNHLSLSWPLNGADVAYIPKFSIIGSFSL